MSEKTTRKFGPLAVSYLPEWADAQVHDIGDDYLPAEGKAEDVADAMRAAANWLEREIARTLTVEVEADVVWRPYRGEWVATRRHDGTEAASHTLVFILWQWRVKSCRFFDVDGSVGVFWERDEEWREVWFEPEVTHG